MPDLQEYNYELPREMIAQQPLPCRSDARLLIARRADGSIEHAHIRDLPQILAPQDTLVLNDTRVIPARLVGYRMKTRGRWQGLFLSSDKSGAWQVLCKTRGRLAPGEWVMLQDSDARDAMRLRMVARLDNGTWIVRPETNEEASVLLGRVGRVPLPHYIRSGEMISGDRETYQTVYAQKPGAIAAPTAGLHFTENLLAQFESRDVGVCFVTLHVGVGTFRPISTQRLSDHQMHSEWGSIEADVVERLAQCRGRGGRIVAVGTTSVRVLETAALGGELQPWQGDTELFIRPGHTFRAVDALLTNFHLPRTTLLVLVRTFGGDDLIKRAYDEAIRESYRFYSYGDAMLIV